MNCRIEVRRAESSGVAGWAVRYLKKKTKKNREAMSTNGKVFLKGLLQDV